MNSIQKKDTAATIHTSGSNIIIHE